MVDLLVLGVRGVDGAGGRAVALLLCLFLLPVFPMSRVNAQVSSAPAQILLRFTDDSSENGAVTAASASDDPTASPDLAEAVATLGRDAGLPLELVQVSSGNWIVLGLNLSSLLDASERRLAGHEAIAATERGAPEGETAGELLIRFGSGTGLGRALQRAVAGDETLEAVTEGLARANLGLPLTVRVAAPDQVWAKLDLAGVTQLAVERLRSLPHVQAAQANHIAFIS